MRGLVLLSISVNIFCLIVLDVPGVNLHFSLLRRQFFSSIREICLITGSLKILENT